MDASNTVVDDGYREGYSTATASAAATTRPSLTHRHRTTGHMDARELSDESAFQHDDFDSADGLQQQALASSSSGSGSSGSSLGFSDAARTRGGGGGGGGVSLGASPLRPRSWGRSISYTPSTERVSSYLEALDLHLLPASVTMSLASLRDALLAYLGEAEAVIEEQQAARAAGGPEDGEVVAAVADEDEEESDETRMMRGSSPEYTTETSCSSEPEQIPAFEMTSESPIADDDTQAAQASSASSSGYSSMLRQRGHALRRRLSGTLGAAPSALLGPLGPSSEALLAQLSSIREDVMASLPALPHLPGSSGTLPRTPSLSSLGASGNRLDAAAAAILPGFLQRLPARLQALNEHINQTATAADSAVADDDGGAARLPSVVRLSPANQERAIQLIRSLLPSDQWAGWEQLGWDDRSAAWRGAGDDDDDDQDDEDDDQENGGDRDAQGLFRKGAEEEPEYFFPFKTPRAAMSRQASWVAAKNKRERSRSLSMSATGVAAAASPEKRPRSKSSVGVMGDEELVGDRLDGDERLGDTDGKTETSKIEIDAHETEVDETTLLLPIKKAGLTFQEALEKSRNGRVLIGYDDIPAWMQNNEYILKGYRFIPLDPKTGPLALLLSMFSWHNETFNIHSHFIPTLLLLGVAIPYNLIYPPLHNPAPLDILTLLAFLLSAAACLFSSAGWHVLSGCSRRALFEWGACVDYVGISWLISCSIHAVYYNGFYCEGRTLTAYTVTTLASAIAGSYLPFQKWFNERQNKGWRIAFFLGISFTAIAPLSHLAYAHGIRTMMRFAAPIVPSIASYVSGLMFYAFHYPESKYPGKFDYLGHSHQIWHVAILFGIYFHYAGTLTIFGARHDLSCAQPWAGPPMSSYLRGYF